MSELSRDARELIAQARERGPELLGPSAAERARLRERLAPLWAAPPPAPRRLLSRRLLGSLSLLAGVGLLCWRLFSAPATPPAAASGTLRTAVAPVQAAPLAGHATQPAARAEAEVAAPASPSGIASAPGARSPSPAQLETRSPRSMAGRNRQRSSSATSEALAVVARRAGPAQGGAAPTSRGTASSDHADHADHTQRCNAEACSAGGQQAPTAAREPERTAPLMAAGSDGTARAVRTTSQPGPRSIEGELELLGEAQSALQAQHPSRALNLLQEHAFRFPRGALSDERMAMQALALCALDRRNAASSVLSDLAARGSRSPLLPRVRRQCGL